MTADNHIDSDDLSIAKLFEDFYVVPDFQREYVWEETQVEKLLQDVYDEFYDENRNQIVSKVYFIGSIVTCKDKEGLYLLIDGQQRLTTSYLVICVIRDLLNEVNSEPPNTLLGQVKSVSLDPLTGNDIARYRLELQYDDSQDVLKKIAGDLVPVAQIEKTTSSVKHILQAHQTIYEFLKANFDNDPAEIKKFLAGFTLRVKLIRIVTPNLSSALKLFETINDRGVGLNSMDLLKNLLFIQTSTEDYQKLKVLWKNLIDILDSKCKEKPLRFLRYYVMANYEMSASAPILREDDIYNWFSSNQRVTGIDTNPLDFVRKIIKSAEAYAYFVKGKNQLGDDNRYLKNIARLSNQAKQHFILLLAGLHLSSDLFEKLTKNIENLFFCYLITREPTRNFERLFARWSNELRSIRSDLELDLFIEKNIEKELSNKASSFRNTFKELSATKIQQYRVQYILAKLAQYVDESALSNEIPLEHYYDAIDVEHILPRNPPDDVRMGFDKPELYDEYKFLLGNLTMLEHTINSSVSNKNFEGKKDGYSSSHIYLTKSIVCKLTVGANTQINRATKELLQFNQWNSEAIIRRQNMLFELACIVWNIPAPEGVLHGQQ